MIVTRNLILALALAATVSSSTLVYNANGFETGYPTEGYTEDYSLSFLRDVSRRQSSVVEYGSFVRKDRVPDLEGRMRTVYIDAGDRTLMDCPDGVLCKDVTVRIRPRPGFRLVAVPETVVEWPGNANGMSSWDLSAIDREGSENYVDSDHSSFSDDTESTHSEVHPPMADEDTALPADREKTVVWRRPKDAIDESLEDMDNAMVISAEDLEAQLRAEEERKKANALREEVVTLDLAAKENRRQTDLASHVSVKDESHFQEMEPIYMNTDDLSRPPSGIVYMDGEISSESDDNESPPTLEKLYTVPLESDDENDNEAMPTLLQREEVASEVSDDKSAPVLVKDESVASEDETDEAMPMLVQGDADNSLHKPETIAPIPKEETEDTAVKAGTLQAAEDARRMSVADTAHTAIATTDAVVSEDEDATLTQAEMPALMKSIREEDHPSLNDSDDEHKSSVHIPDDFSAPLRKSSVHEADMDGQVLGRAEDSDLVTAGNVVEDQYIAAEEGRSTLMANYKKTGDGKKVNVFDVLLKNPLPTNSELRDDATNI